MSEYSARMRVTYSTIVTVEANSEEEAREKLSKGDWIYEQQDDAVNWSVPGRITKDA